MKVLLPSRCGDSQRSVLLECCLAFTAKDVSTTIDTLFDTIKRHVPPRRFVGTLFVRRFEGVMLHYANVSDMVLGREPEGGMVLQQPKVRIVLIHLSCDSTGFFPV